MQLLTTARSIAALTVWGALQFSANAEDAVAETARALAQVANLLPEKSRAVIRERALKILLLDGEGRFLPSTATTAERRELEAALFAKQGAIPAAAGALPLADGITFDGKALAGGNFKNVDALMGVNGRPIALDRQLPALLVPLSAGDADAVGSAGESFHAAGDFDRFAAAVDTLYRGKVAGRFVADCVALRPYAGRIDDFYFHDLQRGTAASALDFYAIAESLAGRSYDPVSGLTSGAAAAPQNFSLTDLLSGGGFSAVQRFRQSNRVAVKNPFTNFALRVLPFIDRPLRDVAGTRLKVSHEMVKTAMVDPRRFAPTPPPPMFPDRSRFFGVLRSGLVPVAHQRADDGDFSAEIASVEAESELPEDVETPAGNELLVDARPEAVSPDAPPLTAPPVGADIIPLVDEVAVVAPAREEAGEAVVASSGNGDEPPAAAPDPPVMAPEENVVTATPLPPPAEPAPAAKPGLRVAVLTPTVAEGEAYLKAIAESDVRLSGNFASSNRVSCYARWIREAATTLDTALLQGEGGESVRAQLESALDRAKAEIARLDETDRQLRDERLTELAARADLGRKLEQRIRDDGGELLQRLVGTRA